jgi:photosystem II stability/assembly factor-like uncharacterized protein
MQDYTYALDASPTFEQDGICFAARQSGLSRSIDGGKSWQSAYESLNLAEPLTTMAVAISPAFASDRSVFAGVPGGVLRSVDGGQNWHVAMLPSPPPAVSTLAISPNYERDGVLLVGTVEDGVFRSGDRGASWQAWNFGLLDLNILSLAISPGYGQDEEILVGAETALYRSSNGGRAWHEVDFPTDLAPVLSLALSPAYPEDGIIFAGTEEHGLYGSDDRGSTWRRLGAGEIKNNVNAIIVSPTFGVENSVLVMAGDAVLLSRDAGESWASWEGNGLLTEDPTAIRAPLGLAPEAPLLVALMDGEVVQGKMSH